VPFIVTTLGGTTAILMIVPALLTVGNLAATMSGRWSLLFGIGVAAMAAVSLVFLTGTSLLEAIGALRAVDARVSGTDWEDGVFVWAMYGTFTLAAFALAEHAMPRILRRAWGGGFLSGAQLWLAFGGATIAGLALMGGGLAQAALIASGATPDVLAAELLIYRVIGFAGFGLVALAGLAMLVNMFLLYTTAEPAQYAAPVGSASAAASH
jgi:cbb3-type cytochrome oxidase subunit 1